MHCHERHMTTMACHLQALARPQLCKNCIGMSVEIQEPLLKARIDVRDAK